MTGWPANSIKQLEPRHLEALERLRETTTGAEYENIPTFANEEFNAWMRANIDHGICPVSYAQIMGDVLRGHGVRQIGAWYRKNDRQLMDKIRDMLEMAVVCEVRAETEKLLERQNEMNRSMGIG